MQIVKNEQNSQPRKDEETHLRKYESPRKHGTKVKKRPNSRAPLRWGGVVANVMAGRHHGCTGMISGVLAMGAGGVGGGAWLPQARGRERQLSGQRAPKMS